ncbi:hypothetical protein JTB14_031470 [Gonioctena quinquepunctata]|nr:hypothetical protein JTB14_031470 [Gonioctena quinquepunctata]
MDVTKEKYHPNPRETAGIFSILTLKFTIPIFIKGRKKTLDVDDLYNPLPNDRSTLLGNALERNWNKQVENARKDPNKKPSLFKAVIRTFWVEYAMLGILQGTGDLILRTTQPLMLGGMLDFYNPNSQVTKTEALCYAAGVVILNASTTIIMTQFMLNAMHCGMRVRAAVIVLIYRKAVKLSRTALGDTPVGKVVNLLSNDVARFDFASAMIHQLWVGPISAIIVMFYLYQSAGLPGIAGILTIVILSPMQAYAGKLSARFRKQTAMKTDERLRLMDEIICGIQIIKMYAWEIPFKKVISLVREAETTIIKKGSYTRAFFMALGMFTTRLALFATLITISLSGQDITASTVFKLMAYFNLLSQTLTGLFVRGLTEIAELMISIKRLQNFLFNEEFEYDKQQNKQDSSPADGKDVIAMKDVTAKWIRSNSDTVLNNINLKVPRGKLIAVIGPVGCGKSSLLQTLLGELDIVGGTMNIKGNYSYASQEPWVFASTIRQNIVFGDEYDKKKYKEVIRICALENDLNQFPSRDLTIVGDKGASLSGGQKARINLARAVYRNADIYLLDDPLSAVDIHVSKVLYEQCINGFLANKTRVLVTHQVHYLKNADHIIIMSNGRIEKEGTFNELVNSDNAYAKLFTEEHQNKPEQTEEPEIKTEIVRRSFRRRTLSVVSSISAKSLVEGIHDDVEEVDDSDEEEAEIQVKDMQEASSKGKVSGSLLLKYMSSGANAFNICLVLTLYILAQTFGSGTDWFVSTWTNIEEYRTALENPNATEIPAKPILGDLATDTCLYIYGTILIILLLLQMFRSFSFYAMAMSCSRKLHRFIFDGIINATMRFFDTNPSGRILNRISKDIGSIDEMLPRTLLDVGQMFLQMGGSLVLVAVINPYAIILILALGVWFWYIRHIYLKSSKNIKRLEGMMRSPAFTQLSATLQGLTTIRALRAEELLKKDFDQAQDYHTSAWFMSISTSSAFGFVLDLCCAGFVGVVTFSLIGLSDYFGLAGGSVGLAITQSTQLSGMVQFAMRMSANISNQLMSVERVLEYKALTPEHQPEKPKTPPKVWPAKGEITFENTVMRYYDEGPTILKNLNLTVKANEKVGIVGRTGAGKSSLISALFRLVKIEGRIIIDGIDTNEILLKDLRSKITIIPQDPVLFSGTLRYNLDPFDEFTDEQLYGAIKEVELKDPANIINRLENRVMDRGSNYSVGQRQLICLARAIIRNNKILMLDEATANVDPQTDALIQKTIRTKFSNCTVLTVAHRLNTIMDSDKVLVMDAGQAAEFDHPHLLLQNKDGIFYEMVASAGPAVADLLRKIARDSYTKLQKLTEEE